MPILEELFAVQKIVRLLGAIFKSTVVKRCVGITAVVAASFELRYLGFESLLFCKQF